ncbi:tetratricopeptide repeat protein [Azospirillum sp. Marseille-Q6669]
MSVLDNAPAMGADIDFEAWRHNIRASTFGLYHYNMGVALRKAGSADTAMAALQRAIEVMPDLVQAYRQLETLLDECGRPVEAAETRHRAMAVDPAYQAKALYHEGCELYDTGSLEQAAASFEEALRHAPDLLEARCYLALVHHTLGHSDVPVPDVPSGFDPVSAFDLGRNYWLLTSLSYNRGFREPSWFAISSRTAEAFIRYRPDQLFGYHHLGCIQREAGQLDAALGMFEESARRFEVDFSFWADFGLVLLAAGDLGRAEETLRRAIALNDKEPMPLNRLGFVLQAQGRADAAVEAHERASALNRIGPLQLSGLAMARELQGNWESALELSRAAVEAGKADPHMKTDPWMLTGFALALEAVGQTEEALEAHRGAIALAPGLLPIQARYRPWAHDRLWKRYDELGFSSSWR